jgi:pSer/pThr/pTyr-binding forkhead associated (FHA) protein
VSANPRAGTPAASEQEALAEAERLGHPFLVFKDRDERQRLFVFTPGSLSASVGRKASSDIALDWDDQVSRSHARFDRIGEDWLVVDDGLSSNGTFVNGERLHGSRRLNDGDALRFGATGATFRAPRSGQIGAAGPAKPPTGPSAQPPPVTLPTPQRRVLAALCRPYKERNASSSPASDEEIAEQMVLSAGEVKAHLRVLCAKLGLGDASESKTRALLVERAFSDRLVSERDL